MSGEALTTFIFFSIVVGFPVICGTLIAIVAIIRPKKNPPSSKASKEETQLIQELHQGMVRLEKRIESLETIIIENEKDILGKD